MKISEGNESNELQHYWRILVRRRWAVYLAVLTFGLISLVSSFVTTPLYKATTTLQIEHSQPDILDMREARTEFWAAFDHFYQTQYEIIASQPVARLAAERLALTSHKDFIPEPGNPGLIARLKSYIPRKNRPRVEREPLDVAAERLRARLEVLPVKYSFLVDLTWVHEDPVFAAEVVNELADAYIHFSLSAHLSTSEQAREFLAEQIVTLKEEIAVMEERLLEYAEDKNILSIDESDNVALQALQDIAEELTIAETALARAEAARQSANTTATESLPEVMRSELIGRLRAEYAMYEAEYSEESRVFGDDWPGMQTLQSRLDQSRRRLELESEHIANQVRAAREAEYLRAKDEVRRLDALLSDKRGAAQRLKRDAVEFASLQSESQKKRETLDALLRRQNEMELSTRLIDADTTSSNITVVEEAKPPTAPFRPRTTLNLVVGLLLGLSLGPALALLLDYLDNTVTSAEEIEKLLSVPVLAVIPQHGTPDTSLVRVRRKPAPVESIDLIAHQETRAVTSEAYRSLRTSILLSNPGRPPRRILLTSSVPEEGKTATALNLGIVLAQLGRRVVLVDTDLRRPRLHSALKAQNRVGASTYLSGLETDPTRLVQATSIEHLYFIPSGPIPPNPSELLNSAVFSRMGDELLEQKFDHIIFDSPPVLSVSDPVIIAAVADTCIVVARAGSTPRQSIRAAVERLAMAGGGPLGVVLNRVSPGSSYHNYEYGSGYGMRAEGAEAETTVEPVKRASGGA
jgi:succinoglycan biosynthesis transport protein ExoP